MFDVGYSDDGLSLATYGPVFLSVFRSPMRLDQIPAMRRLGQALQDRTHGKNVSLTIILPGGAAPMSNELREESTKMVRELPQIASAIMLEGEGFLSATLRAAVSGLVLLARNPYPIKVFGALDAGVDWLRGHCQKVSVELPADVVAAASRVRGG